MSTLKVNKLRDTAGSADAITLDPNGGAVLAGVTTVTSVKVGAAVTISESGIEASGIGITCANINGTQIGGRRNIVINGAMQVAQRGTSSTTNGDLTVDRIHQEFSGTDEAPTFAQVDVASGTTPYTNGFRKALKITNGNQTGGAGTSDMMAAVYKFEAQDVANSGWNYTSASSFITLSYWVKSSVAQNFYGRFQTHDGTSQNYPFETGSLTADTWTKITNTIPGNSNLQFDNDVNLGMSLELSTFRGTDKTGSVSLNAWAAYGGGTTRTPDQTSTWYTTNDATFEITGLQLEVGAQATAFEHRSFGEELLLCQRYFCKSYDIGTAPATATFVGAIHGRNYDASSGRSANPIFVYFVSRMRAQPTMTFYAGDGQSNKYSTGSTVGGTDLTSENTFGTSFINSESGIFHCDFNDSVSAAHLYAFQYTAAAEL